MIDPRLETISARYKNTVASRYRALKLDDFAQIPSGPCYVSPKIDGELWLAELQEGHINLFAKGGRIISDGPIYAALKSLAGSIDQSVIVAGELHSQGTAERRPRVGDVASAMANNDQSNLRFTLFDVVAFDNQAPPVSYGERLKLLEGLIGAQPAPPLQLIETESLLDTKPIQKLIKRWVASGIAEGLVVRSELLGDIYKLKPSLSLDVVVVGFTTRAATPCQVRSLLYGLRRTDDAIQLIGACGNLPGESMREELFKKLESLECSSSFRHSSSDGNLYRFVRPEVVVEINCTDLQVEGGDGQPIRRWALEYCDQGWKGLIDIPSISLIHPVMVRTRPDKTADSLDIRLAQLNEYLPNLNLEPSADPRQLPASEVVRRQVWSKASKSGLAVRKLLVWSSGKQDSWPGWPAWLIHFTDYSPDRQAPLDRTLRTARDQNEAMAIADALVLTNIKKGWEEFIPAKDNKKTKV